MYKQVTLNMGRDSGSISYKDLFRASELFEGDFYAYDGAWLRANKLDWEAIRGLKKPRLPGDK